jgi:hypothetical protein
MTVAQAQITLSVLVEPALVVEVLVRQVELEEIRLLALEALGSHLALRGHLLLGLGVAVVVLIPKLQTAEQMAGVMDRLVATAATELQTQAVVVAVEQFPQTAALVVQA